MLSIISFLVIEYNKYTYIIVAKHCNPTLSVPGTYKRHDGGTAYDMLVVYQCNPGFQRLESDLHTQTIQCQADQNWDHNNIQPCYSK